MRYLLSTQTAAVLVSLALVHCGGSEPEPTTPASLEPQYGQTVSERYMGMGGSASSTTTTSEGATDSVDPSQVQRTAGADDTQSAAAAQLTDSQIAAIASTASAAEIDQGKLAEVKAKDARVKEFARSMIEHHTKAKADLDKLIPRLNMTPNTSQQLTMLQADVAATRSMLETAPSADFDKQYIDSQLEAHRKILNSLETELIPYAINPELKAHLQSLRPRVQAHLQQAQGIRQTLASQDNGHSPSSPGNPGGPDVTK